MENLIDGITLRLQNERRERMGIGNIRKVMATIFFPGVVERLEASHSGNAEYQAG